jgi:hypothetical protein
METQLRPITKRVGRRGRSLSLALDYLVQVSGKARKMYKCDRSTGSGILRPRRVGGDLTLRLHDPDLAGGAGGSAFFAVIPFPRRKLTDPINSRVTRSSSLKHRANDPCSPPFL